MTEKGPSSSEAHRRRRRPARRVLVILWCGLGAGAAIWLGVPGAVVSAAAGATGGVLRAAGLRHGQDTGSPAVAIDDALIAPDFTVRLYPLVASMGGAADTTLDLHIGSILALGGRVSLRAVVTTELGATAHAVHVRAPGSARIGESVRLAVVTIGAQPGLYTLTLTATSGSVTHVASAGIRIS
jgi:hypothetical protein